MAPNAPKQERKKVADLQTQMETQLLALEKLGALSTPAADEIRNIVAEGIATKFGEPYRTFHCVRQGTEIRRDAVPTPCSLRQSVHGFVAGARYPEKNSKTKGRQVQEKVVAEPATASERAAVRALANLTVGRSERQEKPQKTSSPNQSNPAKVGTSNERQQTSLDSSTKAFDAMLVRKVAENKTSAPASNYQKQTARGTGKPMAQGRQNTAVTTPKDGAAAPKVPEAAAAGTSGVTPDHGNITREPNKPNLSSSEKASNASSENLIDFGF